jgi:hypothetical protein
MTTLASYNPSQLALISNHRSVDTSPSTTLSFGRHLNGVVLLSEMRPRVLARDHLWKALQNWTAMAVVLLLQLVTTCSVVSTQLVLYAAD